MAIDLPGFADPVGQAQGTFRAVLEAMSRPGRVRAAGAGVVAPAPLAPATAAVLLTLADAETPVCLPGGFAAAADWVRFHCGAPIVEAAEAVFVVCDALPDLAALANGTDEEPQAGATVLMQVAALEGGAALTIAGPGLAGPEILAVPGLPGDFAAVWAANHALFPRGVDLVICAGEALLALPRTLAVGEG